MKKEFIAIFLFIFLISFTSATIVINTDISDTYNLGDTVNVPIKITTALDLINIKASMKLICNGLETEVYSEYFTIEAGAEKEREPSIPLIKELLGRTTATCKIKTSLGDEFELTEEFSISDKIDVTTKIDKTEYAPEEIIIIEGDATKKNGKPTQGFVEILASISNSTDTIKTTDTVKNGYFYVEIPLAANTKAGDYTINLNVYEKDSKDETTNKGFASESFTVIQIPTSLEIILEEKEVEPGTSLKAKTILHDQTGEKIDSLSIMTIKNSKNDILDQVEISTDEYFGYAIDYNEPPQEWVVVAISNKLNAEMTFQIKEKKDVEIKLLNKTLKITNVGNIIYNDSVLVKIGEESIYINVTLLVDESKDFILTAPKGVYEISILAQGEDQLTHSDVFLTGRSIDIKSAGEGVVTIIRHPIVWFFITAIFGFVLFMFFRKGYQKSIFGYIKSKKKHKNKVEEHKKKFDSLLNFKKSKDKKLLEKNPHKAELSLSIKGTKHPTSIVCLKVKNFEKLEVGKIKDTIEKIAVLAIENKAYIYENGENLFFLFNPLKTKTFKNEKTAIELAQKIKKILVDHNKIFKQKIDFGISINQGEIIAKQEKDSLKFMSLGALINAAKKIANISDQEILLDEKIKTKLATAIKVEKKDVKGLAVYSIKEIKKLGDNKKFLESFINRMNDQSN